MIRLPSILIAAALLLLALGLPVAGQSAPATPMPDHHTSTAAAVEQAHSELWKRFVDQYGIIRDYVGDLPTPEDCKLGRPNVIGWWSPIENGPMFTGLYLPAACERSRRTGLKADGTNARRLAEGLLKCASVSDVPGFIARGIGTDGKCHYPLGSDDQTHPWFLGLHAYLKSGLPTAEERRVIVSKMKEVADVLESNGWKCPADGEFKGQFRGGYTGHLFRDAVRYLYLLRAMHDVTGDPVWLERYQKASMEKPGKESRTRAEICAEGYAFDREAIANIDIGQLWIYVGCQRSLSQLIAMEKDPGLLRHYRAGLLSNVTNALPGLAAGSTFDNNDTKVFGNADWRAVYSSWFPQKTQADAARQAETGDKVKRGQRKSYEVRLMRNPLAAAAMIALAGDGSHRDAVESILRHYDYSKLNMAEFFFAECAWYALPAASK